MKKLYLQLQGNESFVNFSKSKKFHTELIDGFFDERIELKNIGNTFTLFEDFKTLKIYVSKKVGKKTDRVFEVKVIDFFNNNNKVDISKIVSILKSLS